MNEKVGILFWWNFIIPVFIIVGLCNMSVVGVLAGSLNEVSSPPTKGSPSSSEPPISAKKCPNPSTIFPCTCSIYYEQVIIVCDGRTSTQTAIETAFREIREVNGIPEGRGLHIGGFKLNFTELTQLDLAPFYGSRVDRLLIENNLQLSEFVTSGYEEDHRSIQVTSLSFDLTSMGQEGFGDALKYFSKDMESFWLLGLKNRDVDADADKQDNESGEFLPGLSSLTNLYTLFISNCDINGKLNRDRWNFTGFQRNLWLVLSSNNIDGIEEGVFEFDLDEPSQGVLIDLSFNQLNEDSFHPNSGIAKTGRLTHLYLRGNQITTLPSPIFETFLDAHEDNIFYLENLLICDERLSWLKSRREEFIPRVDPDSINCGNDPGHTVFDSSLIPLPPRLPPIFAPLCPNSSAILPCTCSNSSTGLSIFCSGSEVSQPSIETGLREIREVNGIPGGRGIQIYEFVLNETELFVLNLAPFYGSRMESLSITFNAYLMILVTSGYEEDEGSIQVNLLQIVNSPLEDFGFGELLKYFTNDRKTTIDLSNNRITTLPAPIFETFLDAQPQNFLRLTGNPLICDKSLSWIKARAFEFVYWVENANCKNDPGHTVFNSALIP